MSLTSYIIVFKLQIFTCIAKGEIDSCEFVFVTKLKNIRLIYNPKVLLVLCSINSCNFLSVLDYAKFLSVLDHAKFLSAIT